MSYRLLLFCGIAVVPALAAVPEASDAWKFDTITLKNGTRHRGSIVREEAGTVVFHDVHRHPGRPTVVIARNFAASHIERIERIDDKERTRLRERLKALDPTGKMEDERIRALDLKPAEWVWGQQTKGGLSYDREGHFTLFSTARRDIVERAALRLEEVYAAYTSYLPPRRLPRPDKAPAPRPLVPLQQLFGADGATSPRLMLRATTTILLAQSRAEYHEMLKSTGLNLLNPAYYDAARNEVVCASELEQLGEKLERIRAEHDRQLTILVREETKAHRLPAGEVRDRVAREIAAARQEILRVSTDNEAQFSAATRHLFQTLYHEAFHAYLASYVYPPAECQVPRWLNEGLAQVFEGVTVENGVLHVERADPVRLERARRALLADKPEERLVPLIDLLRSESKQFLMEHAVDRRVAARHYLTAWALAHYLAFDRQLLGSKALDEYVETLSREGEPAAAFARLVGQELPAFEKGFHEYLRLAAK